MNSLRNRLIVTGSAILAVFGILTFFALDRAFRASATSAQEEKMKGLVYSLLGAIDPKEDGTLVLNELALQEQRLFFRDSGLAAAVIGEDRSVIWKSPSWKEPSPEGLPQIATGEWAFGTSPIFRLGFGVSWQLEENKGRTFTIYVDEDRKAYGSQLQIYHRTLAHWLFASAVLLLGTLIGLLIWVLRPLRKVVGELEEIQGGKREGIDGAYPVELLPVTDGLNSLLRHERSQQKRYRHALDDLAHSLKTPLAALKATADARHAEQIEQIDKILEYQVRRASAAGRTAFTAPISPRRITEKIVAALSKVYRDKKLEFELQLDPKASVPMDEGDLMEMLGNLLENAAKWAKERVRISGETDGEVFRISVEDDGPGFPKEKRSELLGRGVRADRKVEGEGIGLSVVADIVTIYEGRLDLSDSDLGGGKVTVSVNQ